MLYGLDIAPGEPAAKRDSYGVLVPFGRLRAITSRLQGEVFGRGCLWGAKMSSISGGFWRRVERASVEIAKTPEAMSN